MAELVSPGEIAKRLGVSPSAVSRWAERSRAGSDHPIRPKFPKPVAGKMRSWAEVHRWALRWKEYHPGTFPGLSERSDQAAIKRAEAHIREAGACSCPSGVVDLSCPVHAKGIAP